MALTTILWCVAVASIFNESIRACPPLRVMSRAGSIEPVLGCAGHSVGSAVAVLETKRPRDDLDHAPATCRHLSAPLLVQAEEKRTLAEADATTGYGVRRRQVQTVLPDERQVVHA